LNLRVPDPSVFERSGLKRGVGQFRNSTAGAVLRQTVAGFGAIGLLLRAWGGIDFAMGLTAVAIVVGWDAGEIDCLREVGDGGRGWWSVVCAGHTAFV
jgi:hypothetical protein